MQAILDFSQELDVPLLDRVVQVMYTTAGAEVRQAALHERIVQCLTLLSLLLPLQQQEAQRTLTQFQEHPDAWQRVPAILETSTNLQAKVGPLPHTESSRDLMGLRLMLRLPLSLSTLPCKS